MDVDGTSLPLPENLDAYILEHCGKHQAQWAEDGSLVGITAQTVHSLYSMCYDQIQERNKVIAARDARIEELEKIVDNSATENEAIGKVKDSLSATNAALVAERSVLEKLYQDASAKLSLNSPASLAPPISESKQHLYKGVLKNNPIPMFDGHMSLEKVTRFRKAVQHHSDLLGLQSEADTIRLAINHLGPDARSWCKKWLVDNWGVLLSHTGSFPFTWAQFLLAFEARYIPAYAVESTLTEMRALSMKTMGVEAYNERFTELAEYAGVDRAVTRGNNVYNIYVEKLNSKMRDRILDHTLQAQRSGEAFTLNDAMKLVSEVDIASRTFSTRPDNHQQPQNQTQPRTSSDHPTAPAPMDLSATSIRKITDANTCSRCFGRGHWSYDCPTKRDYKPGDPVKRGLGGGRGRGTRGNWRNVEGRATGVELGNAPEAVAAATTTSIPPPSSPSQASVSENGQQ